MPRVFLGLSANPTHAHPWKTVEKSNRAQHAFDHLRDAGLTERCTSIEPRLITEEELRTIHKQEQIDEVDRLTASAAATPEDRELCEPDGPGGVYYTAHAATAARMACGCVVDSALAALRPTEDRAHAFAIVRPPGHHAGFDDTPGHRAEGFCFFNHVAVAACCALASGRATKVAIVDWDVHHGNGTQRLFYDDPRVLYVSLHRWGDGWYPLSGALGETGQGRGEGTTVNVPWPENGLGDSDYCAAMELVVLPILASFGPDLCLCSAGFDAAEGDPQGRMAVTPAGFAAMASMLAAGVSCPLACALEGGYNARATADGCEAVLRALLGDETPPPPKRALSRACEPTIRQVVATQQAHWPALRGTEAALDAYFCRAAEGIQPARSSKRKASSAL